MIRYAIVGAGMMGQEHIKNIMMLDGARIAAIIDPDEGMRTAAAALVHRLDAAAVDGSLALHTDIDDWLPSANTNADCVVIASPNHTHISVLKKLLKTSLPLMVEKPLCTTVEHVDEVCKWVAERRAPVWVAMEYRYMPPTSRLLERVAAGDVGQIKMLSIKEHRYPFLDKVGQWNRFNRNTGGTLVEKCCHYFDLMRLITGSEAIRVYASGAIDVNHLDEEVDDERPDIIDNAFAIVDFENGMRGCLDLCMFTEGSDPQETVTVVGDKAKLEARIPGPDRFWPDAGVRHPELLWVPRAAVASQTESIPVDERLAAAGDHHGSTFFQHQKFQDVVANNAAVEVTALDGARAVQIGAAAELSIQTGQAVSFSTDSG